jgi:hypothetical protein
MAHSPKRAGVAPSHVPGRRAGHGGVPGETARQIARSRALCREVNERISEIADDFGVAERFSIFCECASTECQERIELTPREYDHLRRMPTHFAVVRGHDLPAVERVVQEADRFVTVEKFVDSGVTAITLNRGRLRT